MKRINGYIDLSSEIRKTKINKRKNLVQTTRCSTDAYWIKNLNDKNYLFKVILENNQQYRSLIIEKMAAVVDIPVPHTELAILGYYKGELIEDYRKEGFSYISGTQILYEFFLAMKDTEYIKSIIPEYLLKEKLNEEELEELFNRLNNLETIWNALDFHYRKYPNKNTIVENMMSELAKRFAFDFITMQRDRHSSNWEVEENESTSTLTPHFDSNRSFYYPFFHLKFRINNEYHVNYLYEELEYFLTYSDSFFCDYFYKLYELFTPEYLKKLIDQIEEELAFKFPKETLLELTGPYMKHYNKLTEIVERRKKNR
jgi:hypothetical protein